MSFPMLTLEDREHSHTIASDGELFAYLIPYQNLFVTSQIVLFVPSNKDLIVEKFSRGVEKIQGG